MSITGDSAIINAEKKMGINYWDSPWLIQVFLLGFTLGPLIGGLAIARALAGNDPKAIANFQPAGLGFAGLLYAAAIIFLLQTFLVAHSSKWFELSYIGDFSDNDWSHTFRFKNAVDLGEAVPLEVPVEGSSNPKYGIPKPGWARPLARPQSKKLEHGHCWEITLFDKSLPMFCAWLPQGENFETCFSFKNHSVLANFRALPWQVEDGTRGTFIRTSYTKDPNGRIVPVGVFSHNDYVARQLRQELEPIEPVKGEVQALVQTRDNYYRHDLALQLELEKKKNTWLEQRIQKSDDDGYEKAGALFQAAKGRHKKEPQKISITTSRRTQMVIIVLALALTILGGAYAVSGGKIP